MGEENIQRLFWPYIAPLRQLIAFYGQFTLPRDKERKRTSAGIKARPCTPRAPTRPRPREHAGA